MRLKNFIKAMIKFFSEGMADEAQAALNKLKETPLEKMEANPELIDYYNSDIEILNLKFFWEIPKTYANLTNDSQCTIRDICQKAGRPDLLLKVMNASPRSFPELMKEVAREAELIR